jgi:predicted alpha/beta hydrolase family esterase
MSGEIEWNGPVLVAPGLRGSGPDHWQTRWQQRHPRWRRVEQADWAAADLDAWARRIVEAALLESAPVLVIAHSFGCLATVRAAAFQSRLIAGALLVAPANPAKFGSTEAFGRTPLPFPSTVVASRDDPYMPFTVAQDWAGRWDSRFVDVGARGHLNAESALGDWFQGQRLLDHLCRRLRDDLYRAPARPLLGWAA